MQGVRGRWFGKILNWLEEIDHRQNEIELKINGILIQDQERLANIFNNYFL